MGVSFHLTCDCVLQNELSKYLYESLSKVPNVRIYGPPPGPKGDGRASLCSFNVEGIHATDLASFLDQQVEIFSFVLIFDTFCNHLH